MNFYTIFNIVKKGLSTALFVIVLCSCLAQNQNPFHKIVINSIESCIDSMQKTMKIIDPYHICYTDTNVYINLFSVNQWKQGLSKPAKVIDIENRLVYNLICQNGTCMFNEKKRIKLTQKIFVVSLESVNLYCDTLVVCVQGFQISKKRKVRRTILMALYAIGQYKYVYHRNKNEWILVQNTYSPYAY